MVAGVTQDVLVSGHTHAQFDRMVHGRRWINAGSVGMPYEGRPGAFWALLGSDVSLTSTPYDFERAAHQIRATAVPKAEEFARGIFVTPMTAAEASKRFEKWAAERVRT
jgi:hypothetical protein